jgi:tetratricopeptide (TPR) repeat protein
MAAKDDYYLQGVMWHRVMTHQGNRLARRMFQRAIDEDGNFARAHGFLSYARLIGYLNDWKETGNVLDNDVRLADVLSSANDAVRINPDDYETQWSLAAASVYNKHIDDGLAAYDRAIYLAEHDRQAIPENISILKVEKADALMFRGEEDMVLEAIRIADAENAGGYSRPWYQWTLGWAYYELGHYRDETFNAIRSLEYLSKFQTPPEIIQKNVVATYMALGWVDSAKGLAKQLRGRLRPDYDPNVHEDKWPHQQGRRDRLGRWKRHLREALA